MRLRWLVTFCSPLFCANLYAQTLEPVQVQADLRANQADQTNTSVEIYDHSAIEDQGATHLEDLLLQTPNVNFSGQSSRPRHIQIRGLGERESYTGAPNASVAVAIDGIDFSNMALTGGLFDTQQVEILRGPQNTRYGQSAIGGLINIRSQSPVAQTEHRLETSLGQNGLKELGLMTNGTLSDAQDATRYRLVLFKHQSDGAYQNHTTGRADTNGRDELNARLKVLFFPSPNTEAELTLIHADYNNRYDVWTRDNSFNTYSDYPGRDNQRSQAIGLNARWFAPTFTLHSQSGFTHSDMLYAYDGDWLADPTRTVGFYHNDKYRRQFSQDLRWISNQAITLFNQPTDWLAGLYFSTLDEGNQRHERYDYTMWGDQAASDADSQFNHHKLAAYGQIDHQLNQQATLTYSLRIEHNQQYFDMNTRKHGLDISYGSGAYDYPLHDKHAPAETLWGGAITYAYQFNPIHRGHIGLTRGFKAGGFNTGLSHPTYVRFNAETLLNYEIGHNATWETLGLTLSTTLFYMDRDQPQFDGSAQEPQGNEWVYFTENLKRAQHYGLETQLDWQITRHWQLFSSAGLLKTAISGQPINQSFSIQNREMAYAPNYQYRLGSHYRWQTGWYVFAQVRGMDSFYFDNINNEKSRAYALFDARLGYESQHYDIYLWGKNLSNERYATRGYFFDHFDGDGAQTYLRLGEPRQIGITLRAHF